LALELADGDRHLEIVGKHGFEIAGVAWPLGEEAGVGNVLKLVGEPEDKAASDATAIMQLETALAKVSMDITSRRDPNKIYHLMPVTELDALAPNLSWDQLLASLGTPKLTEINVANPDFMKGRKRWLQKRSR
jgi:predicted metalloendopeptidase